MVEVLLSVWFFVLGVNCGEVFAASRFVTVGGCYVRFGT